MKILSFEPTPNPNSMKITLDESLPEGIQKTFSNANAASAPLFIQKVLDISGVKSVFQTADFISIERNPKQGWESILTAIKALFDTPDSLQEDTYEHDPYGAANVFVQMIKGLPTQVKVLTPTSDHRFALPDRIVARAKLAASASADYLKERHWISKGVMYGDPQEIGSEVVAELSARFNEETLDRLLQQALGETDNKIDLLETAPYDPNEPSAEKRYSALERLELSEDSLPVLLQAIQDTSPSVRRLATAYLGTIEGDEVLPHLLKALKDPAVAVRRAAGDALSDRGERRAIPAMAEALKDPSKIVRWRAARFLYEVGDSSVLPDLQAAFNDPEFEVRLQAKLAIERIESGGEQIVPAWQKHLKDLLEGE